MIDELKDQEKAKNDVLMVLYYVGKLVEGGFIAGGPKVTSTGFDMAMDLKEAGRILTEERVRDICEVYKFEPISGFTALIMEVQRTGLPAMLKAQAELEKDANNN